MKLNQANLNLLKAKIPRYDRSKVGQSVVHIGVGGFHRAHQTVYTEDLFHQGADLRWGYCGLGLLPHDARMRDVMRAQDHLYTLWWSATWRVTAPGWLGSIVNYMFAPDNREAALEKMASPETKIVSMTITEGGYYVHSGTGEFDSRHPDILRDLTHPHEPHCSFGFLLEALDRRRQRGQAPFHPSCRATTSRATATWPGKG